MSNLDKIDPKALPQHVGIIMDGNGRWALRKKQSRIFGHKKGVEALRHIIESCGKHGVSVLTISLSAAKTGVAHHQKSAGLNDFYFLAL